MLPIPRDANLPHQASKTTSHALRPLSGSELLVILVGRGEKYSGGSPSNGTGEVGEDESGEIGEKTEGIFSSPMVVMLGIERASLALSDGRLSFEASGEELRPSSQSMVLSARC